MSLSPELAAIFREEARRALGREASPASVGQDLALVLSSLGSRDARVFASRIHDAALEYLVATDQGLAGAPVPTPSEPDPGSDPEPPSAAPAVSAAPAPESETAPADAVADTPPAEEPSADAA